MKRKYLLLLAVGLIAIAALVEVMVFGVFNRDVHLMHNIDVVKEYPQLTVDVVMKEPGRYTETIAVEGVVNEVTRSSASFTLDGGVPGMHLKVAYRATLPVAGDKVIVIGKLRKSSDVEYVLEAQEIELK